MARDASRRFSVASLLMPGAWGLGLSVMTVSSNDAWDRVVAADGESISDRV